MRVVAIDGKIAHCPTGADGHADLTRATFVPEEEVASRQAQWELTALLARRPLSAARNHRHRRSSRARGHRMPGSRRIGRTTSGQDPPNADDDPDDAPTPPRLTVVPQPPKRPTRYTFACLPREVYDP